MKVAVIGSRRFENEVLVRWYVRALPSGTTVVSGACRGPDSWAEDEAKACDLETEIYPADWTDLTAQPCVVAWRADGSVYNVLAGFNRNSIVANVVDEVIAFVVDDRGGTADTVAKARARRIPILRVFPDGREERESYRGVEDEF